MEIAYAKCADQFIEEWIEPYVNEDIVDAVDLSISVYNRPSEETLSNLSNIGWFTHKDIDLDTLIKDTTLDHEIIMNMTNYSFNKLSDEEKEEVYELYSNMGERLQEEYGDKVRYSVILTIDDYEKEVRDKQNTKF